MADREREHGRAHAEVINAGTPAFTVAELIGMGSLYPQGWRTVAPKRVSYLCCIGVSVVRMRGIPRASSHNVHTPTTEDVVTMRSRINM